MKNLIRAAGFVILGFTFLGHAGAKEAAPPPKVAANNHAKVKSLAGKTVTLFGKISRANQSKSGNHFLNFYSSDVTIFCAKKDATKFKSGGPAKLFANKEVEVTGKLESYKGKPQIKIISPQQIRLANSTSAGKRETSTPSLKDVKVGETGKTPSLSDVRVGGSSSPTKKFELKQVGKTTWVSPAGLKYAGKDPQGLTRVEHVLRHAADQPRRSGPHGVFDGGNDKALETVDAAWKIAKQKKIKPKNEGHRSAYTIPMGRRVGFLGGKTGAQRRNPALKKVFIVVRTGTSEVITAFPK